MVKKVTLTFLIFSCIALLATAVIMYSRGYRFNTQEKTISSTGILSVSSFPDRSSIWINGKLKTTTDASIILPPDWYMIKIQKEGYQSWEKRVRVQGEVVTQIDALLVPSNPSLSALTVTGVISPQLSPSGTKVAFIIPSEESTGSATFDSKAGVWLLELRTGTFGGKTSPKALFLGENKYDWTHARLEWAPDETALILLLGEDSPRAASSLSRVFNLNLDGATPKQATDITQLYTFLQDEWKAVQKEKQEVSLAVLPPLVEHFLVESSSDIRFSPDESKILYTATKSASLAPVISPPLIGSNTNEEAREVEKDNIYVYDRKEDKNFLLYKGLLENRSHITWYSDSKHIVMIEKDTIYINDYDGSNKRRVYSGPFDKQALFVWPGGEKLVILTNLNNPTSIPNFYIIDLS